MHAAQGLQIEAGSKAVHFMVDVTTPPMLQILVVCALLVRVMGIWSAAAGLFVTLLLIPTSSIVGKRLAAARRAVVGQTDARVKLTTEVSAPCLPAHRDDCLPASARGRQWP